MLNLGVWHTMQTIKSSSPMIKKFKLFKLFVNILPHCHKSHYESWVRANSYIGGNILWQKSRRFSGLIMEMYCRIDLNFSTFNGES